MNRLFCAIAILIFSLQSMGQVSKVKNQLERAASNMKKSWESANKSIGEIQKCNLSTTLTDLQFNANKSIAEIEEASSWAKEAENEVDGAEGEASSINCSEAKAGAASTEKYFKKAKNSFDDALSSLRMTLEEEDGNTIIDYLNSTLISIEKGMNNLKKGAEELEKTFYKLGECK